MNRILFFIVFIFFAFQSKAQSLTGKIRDGESGLALNAVQVFNQSNKTTTYSNTTGFFAEFKHEVQHGLKII